VFIVPTAVIIGDVYIGEDAGIWDGAVLRGDEGKIVIGARSNVQDNAVIHTTPECPTEIGTM
jgi:carbonic anhydrase/acetyltransferase-like protein (isoleucine patch superfamily)